LISYFGVGSSTNLKLPGVPHQDVLRLPFPPAQADPAECIAQLPLETRVGQLVMPSMRAEDAAAFSQTMSRDRVGGVMVFNQPQDPTLLNTLKSAANEPVWPLIAVDEEGGSVQRFAQVGTLPAAGNTVRRQSSAQVEQMITEHGLTLHAMGIDMVFGPVLDIAGPDAKHNPLGDRSFSNDPNIVIDYGAATMRGWNASGIVPTVKQWPGHGSARGNTDYGPAPTPSLAELQHRDLLPYQAPAVQAQRRAIMVGNLNVPGLTEPGLTASISPAAYNLLNSMGDADTPKIVDSLDAAAIKLLGLQPGPAAVAAISAGADIALHAPVGATTTPAETVDRMVESLTTAVRNGTLPEARVNQAVGHVLVGLKGINPCDVPRS
jgi:beta-N-acetylhexosaminidase